MPGQFPASGIEERIKAMCSRYFRQQRPSKNYFPPPAPTRYASPAMKPLKIGIVGSGTSGLAAASGHP